MKTWRCVDPYPYFNLTTGLCQTQCGGFFYENATTGTCVACNNSKCYQCDSSNSTNCTYCASYLFYQLNTATGNCVCIFGFF